MRTCLNFLLIPLLFFGCTKRHEPEQKQADSKPNQVHVSVDLPGVNYQEVYLADELSAVELKNTINIGNFFDHRLQFFKINNPALKIGPGAVEEIVFYYVDSALVKLRYKVKGNVFNLSNFLLDSLGMSKFKPLDDYSKEQIKQKNLVKRSAGIYMINEDLKNYELIWRQQNTLSRFKVNIHDGDTVANCFYYHELEGYKAKIRELETVYHALDNAILDF